MMKLLIDPRQSGLSGDMFISTLTDFFNCHEFTNNLLDQLCTEAEKLFSIKASYKVEKTVINHFSGSKLLFSIENDFEYLSVHEFIEKWKVLLDACRISKEIIAKVFKILDTIVSIEQEVHGTTGKSLNEIHFHELNSIDTIVDITVSVAILDKEHIDQLHGLPTAIGSGTITFSHGTFQQPAPAVAKLLEKTSYPIISRELDFELTTPTGLAIVTTVVDSGETILNLPTGKIQKIGLGFGQKQPKNYLNFLRMWSIEEGSFETDSMVVIETHVDDATGELLGNIIESYSTVQGVKDVSIYPLIMKKNRPGNCIRLLVDPQDINIDELSVRLMKDTGSLGVRHYPVSRHKSVREMKEKIITFNNEQYKVRVKISKIGSEIIAMKPEYDDIKAISVKTKKGFKEIQDIILNQIKKEL